MPKRKAEQDPELDVDNDARAGTGTAAASAAATATTTTTTRTSATPAKKKSKRERLEEMRARAKESMKEDKATVLANRKKLMGVGSPGAHKEDGKEKKVKATTPAAAAAADNNKPTRQSSKATGTKKNAKASTKVASKSSNKNSNSNIKDKKSTINAKKKQQQQQQQQQTQPRVGTAPGSVPIAIQPQPPFVPMHIPVSAPPAALPHVGYNSNYYNSNYVNTTAHGDSNQAMAAFFHQQQQQHLVFQQQQQQQQQQQMMAASPVPQGNTSKSTLQQVPAQMPVHPNMGKTSYTTSSLTSNASEAKAKSFDKEDNKEEESAPPPPPLPTDALLQAQISQQVLQNAQAAVMNDSNTGFGSGSSSSNAAAALHVQPPPLVYQVSSEQKKRGENELNEHFDDKAPIVIDGIAHTDENDTHHHSTTWSYTQEKEQKRGNRGFTFWLGVVVVFAIFLSCFFSEEQTITNTSSEDKHTATVAGDHKAALKVADICYADSEPRYTQVTHIPDGSSDEETTTTQVLIDPCPPSNPERQEQPCPVLGKCIDGKLVECQHGDFQVSSDGINCQLVPTTQVIVDQWMAALEKKTIQRLCDESYTGFPMNDIMVPFEELQNDFPELPPLDRPVLQFAFPMIKSDIDGSWLLQLPYSVSTPLECRLQQMLATFFKKFFGLAASAGWWMVRIFVTYTWRCTSAYPLLSLIGLVVLIIIRWYQSLKQARKQLIMDVATMRDKTFDYLRAHSQEAHSMLALRDEIVCQLVSPSESLNRSPWKYYCTQVWPRVAPQLLQDHRLHVSKRIVGVAGNGSGSSSNGTRDFVQWIAATSSSSSSSKARFKRDVRVENERGNSSSLLSPPQSTSSTTKRQRFSKDKVQ